MRTSISLLPRIVLCLVPVAIAGASHAAGDASAPPVPIPAKGSVILQAESGRIDPDRAVIVEQESFGSKKGVSLKEGAAANVGTVTAEPDLVFRVRAAEPGRYVIRTHAATDAKGTEAMRRFGLTFRSRRASRTSSTSNRAQRSATTRAWNEPPSTRPLSI